MAMVGAELAATFAANRRGTTDGDLIVWLVFRALYVLGLFLIWKEVLGALGGVHAPLDQPNGDAIDADRRFLLLTAGLFTIWALAVSLGMIAARGLGKRPASQ
ncbi:MAG: hypothetical protein ACKVPY_03660 [Paracoccaceae bacterium]